MEQEHIQRELGNLRGSLDAGFRGVHERLDKLNGSVAKHEEWLHSQDKQITENSKHKRKSTETGEKWRDRVYNALFSVILVLVFWILMATDIIQPPL